jgi:membrane protein DedA with SNARE-associated domain
VTHRLEVQGHDQSSNPEPLPTRVVRATFALVAALTLASLVGTALAPVLLLRSPLLLLTLSPDARHVALAVGRLAPAVLLAVVVSRRALFSIGAFGLGVIYGPAGMHWVEARSPRLGKVLRFAERLIARWGAAVLLVIPFASVCMLAGAARLRFVQFISATLLGHGLWVASTYYIGTLLSDFTDRLLAFLSSHLIASTLVCIGVVLLQQIIARRRKKTPR